MTFDICFATYNSERWLQQCVLALTNLDYDKKKIGLYFADNASTDGTLNRLEQLKTQVGEQFGNFCILPGSENAGFGTASNRAANAGNRDYVFFLNVDTEIHPNALIELEHAITSAPRTAGGFELRQEPYEFPKYYDPVTMQTNWISGAAFVMPRWLFEKTGGFDERIFMYCEDVDLSWKIRAEGYTLHHVPKAVITHYTGDVKAPPKRLALIYTAAGNAFLRLKYGDAQQIAQIDSIAQQYARICGDDLRAAWQLFRQVDRMKEHQKELEAERQYRKQFEPEIRDLDFQWRRAGYDYQLHAVESVTKVSVVLLPKTYEEGWAERALQTVANQTCAVYQVLIVSPDESDRSLQREFPQLPIQTIISERAATRAGALNCAREQITGDYCQFLCDETYLFADHFQVFMNEVHQNPKAQVLCCSTLEISPQEMATDMADQHIQRAKSVSGTSWMDLGMLLSPRMNWCKNGAVWISRARWNEVGNLREDLGIYEMQMFWLDCIAGEEPHFVDRDGVLQRSLSWNYRIWFIDGIGQSAASRFRKALQEKKAQITLDQILDCHRVLCQQQAAPVQAVEFENAASSSVGLFQKIRAFCKGNRILSKFYRILAYLRYYGFKKTVEILRENFYVRTHFIINPLHAEKLVSAKGLIAQKGEMRASVQKKIGVLLLSKNANPQQLRFSVESLRNQTADCWVLFADSAAMSGEQRGVISDIAKRDRRVQILPIEKIPYEQMDYLTVLEGKDFLHPAAFYHLQKRIAQTQAQILYTDEQEFLDDSLEFLSLRAKPDYAPDTFLSHPYLHRLTLIQSGLVKATGTLEWQEPLFWDQVSLRCARKAERIEHLPYALYYTRVDRDNTAEESRIWASYVSDVLKEEAADAYASPLSGTKHAAVRVYWPLKEDGAKVSIVIQNKDQKELLKTCVDSIFACAGSVPFEVLIVENNSTKQETFSYYDELEKEHENLKVLYWEGSWNYSALNNFAVRRATGNYLLFLNNDVQVLTPGWLDELMRYARRPDVGAVGAKMYYTDGEVQHGGVILGLGGLAGHGHRFAYKSSTGYDDQLAIAVNQSAQTGACLLMSRSTYDQVGGFDESLAVVLNDVDICLKIRQTQKLILFVPFVELLHNESKSRGTDAEGEKLVRNRWEVGIFLNRWKTVLDRGDPYYNINLSKDERYAPEPKPIPEVE